MDVPVEKLVVKVCRTSIRIKISYPFKHRSSRGICFQNDSIFINSEYQNLAEQDRIIDVPVEVLVEKVGLACAHNPTHA